MASSEYGAPGESEVVLEGADVYKATSNSDYVVVRRVRLYRTMFITYHNIEENPEDNKQWILSSQCELVPRSAPDIRDAVAKYVRPRGQWAITTLVKPKSIGTPGQRVNLYMFTLSWPTRWAAKGYSSFSFGFESLEEARQWHSRLRECLETMRAEKAASASTPSAPQSGNSNNNNNIATVSTSALHARLSNSSVPPTGGGGSAAAVNYGRTSGVPVLQAAASVPSNTGAAAAAAAGTGLLAKANTERAPVSSAETRASSGQVISPGGSPEERARGQRAAGPGSATAVNSSTLASTSAPPSQRSSGAPPSAPVIGAYHSSSFASATATAAAAAAAGLPAAKPPPASGAAAAAAPAPPPPPPPSSTDSEGNFEDLEDGISAGHHGSNMHHTRGSTAALSGAVPPCRQTRGTARGDVHHSRQRWVPYKQVNGVAIYYRPQTAGDAEAGVGGEFMVSTVVRGSPRRCLTALTSHCGTTTILGPAIVQEVLQRRQAIDEKEILRIVVQAPGVSGVICAPRELVVETVFKTDETGPTLVLMFNSCEPPARFVESKPGGQQQQQQTAADDTGSFEAASEGGSRSWWRRPVLARVRGGYTMAPLEDNSSLDASPEALVTCIMKVDLGGVCGERSWLRLVSNVAGWTDAFVDRMLMAVTLLRDEVEQSRFVVQPLSMMASSSRLKEREREAGAWNSTADLMGLGVASRSGESTTVAAAAGSAASGLRRLQGTLQRGGTIARGRSRLEVADRPTLVDGPQAEHSPVGGAACTAAASGGGAAATAASSEGAGMLVEGHEEDQSGAEGAAHGAEAGAEAEGGAEGAEEGSRHGAGGPSLHRYETLEDILTRMRGLSFLDPSVWDNLHQPGKDAPFKIRGPTYLKDRKKIPAGYSRFVLGSMDVIQQPPGQMHEHVARFIPAIRQSGAPFSVIVHLVIPGTPLLGIVATFVTDRHPSTMGTPPASPMEDDHDWEPFDFCLYKYMNGSNFVRNHMLKLIPHIADGSWMIKQSVGTTPVILGKQLRTIYYETPQYIEIDIDISANNVASYVTGLVRGATRSLVIDMGFVLEGTTPWELPEALLGTLRLYHLDIRCAKLIDTSHEIPLRPPNMAPPPSLKDHPYTAGVPESAADAEASGGGSAAAAGAPAANPTMPSIASPTSRVSGSGGGGSAAATAAPVSNGGGSPGSAAAAVPAAPSGGSYSSGKLARVSAGGAAATTNSPALAQSGPLAAALPADKDAASPDGGGSGTLRPPSAVQTPQPLRITPSGSGSGVAAPVTASLPSPTTPTLVTTATTTTTPIATPATNAAAGEEAATPMS